jgi:sensor domain CHASE-containing protein
VSDLRLSDAEARPVQGRTLSRTYLACLFCIFLVVFGMAAWDILQSHVEQRRALALQEATERADAIERRLEETMGAAYLMAGAIIQDQGRNPGVLVNAIAPQLLMQFPLAAAIQAAPKGVVRYSYPLKGHEQAIGHDLLVDPTRNREAHLAVSSGKLTLAGPFQLVQGGNAVVVRFPVYLANTDGWPKFWGFTTVLVRVPALLDAAGLIDLQRGGYHYSVCRVLDQGGCEVFDTQGSALPVAPVRATMNVPNGKWILAVSPVKGWWRPAEGVVVTLICLVLAVAHTVLIQHLYRRRESRQIQARSAL